MLPAIPTLKRDTLEATYEHVNRLVKEESGENYDNVKEFIEYDESLNVFEKKVQAIIVDSLKIKEGVINGLLSDDVHLIRRVLNCNWFFEDAVSPEFYENSIFPNVSFSTRCKIINKLSRNIKSEEHAEQLFQFTRRNYGSKYAEMFLPRCSSDFISTYISECKPLFHHNNSVKILINISKRFPNIAVSFLETVFHKDYPHKSVRRIFSKLILFIARNFPDVFMPFFEKYYTELLFFRFGKKLTKTFAPQLRHLVLNSSGKLLRGVIDNSTFFKCLTFKDQVDFLDSLVRAKHNKLSISNWSLALPSVMPLMRLKPPGERIRLLDTAFSKIYNQKFSDYPKLWSPRFLEILPMEYRMHYVDVLRKMREDEIMDMSLHKECEDEDREVHDIFLYLLDCKTAFPKLTELMSKMPTAARREILLKEMIRNCVINEDVEGLESVLRYIMERHKNDDPRMIAKIMQNLRTVSPKMLSLNVWHLIEQMATLVLLNAMDYYLYRSFMERYIRFRLASGLDVDVQVKNIVKLNFVQFGTNHCLLESVRKPFSKDIFALYYKEIVGILESDAAPEDVREKLLMALLRTMNEYNSSSRRNRINVKDFPFVVEEVDRMMKTSKWGEGSPFLELTDQLMKDPFFREKYATNLLQVSLLPKTLEHLLKFKPDYVVNSLENILNDLFSIYGHFTFKKFITSRCRLDFLNITSKIEKITCEKFKTSVSCKRKINALKMYSYFASIDDFANLVTEYVPDRERMHFDKDNGEFIEIQMTVPQVIKNVKPDSKNLSLLSKYLNGDFLRWSVSSFNSACHNSPVGMILPVLKELFPSKSTSVKKVILHRITDISVNDEKLKYFRELWESERHSSLRSVVFQTISKCFFENPTNEIFEIIKKCVSEADELTIKDRPKLSTIPAQYLNEYTISLWKFTERIESNRFTTNIRNELIQHFAPMNIWILSEDFCEMILKRYLFDENAKVSVNNFSCYYLISNPYSMNQKLYVILRILRDRRRNYACVASFLSLLRRLSLEDPKRFVGVFDGILEEWPKIYSEVKLFDQYLLLQYARSYIRIAKSLKFRTEDPSLAAEFGKELRGVVNSVDKYECLVDVFRSTVEDFASGLRDFDIVAAINHFLGDGFDRSEAIIATGLLPQNMVETFKRKQAGDFSNASEMCDQFQVVVNKLKGLNDSVVKIHLNLRLGHEID